MCLLLRLVFPAEAGGFVVTTTADSGADFLRQALADTDGSGVQPRLQISGANRLIEFPAEVGKWYRVRYSHDLVHWQDCPVPLQAGANRLQWIDSGPPFTESPPASVPARYYIVNEIGAP